LAKAKKQSAAITLKGQSGSIKNHKKWYCLSIRTIYRFFSDNNQF
jgi:hypothetical protein